MITLGAVNISGKTKERMERAPKEGNLSDEDVIKIADTLKEILK